MFNFLFKRRKGFPIFIRWNRKIAYRNTHQGSFWNVQNISHKPEIIEKVYKHFKSARIIYYWFNYSARYVFYSRNLKSWCVFTHRNGMFFDFYVHRTGIRYDIHYEEDLQQVPEFYNLIMYLYKEHREEYLEDMNL